MNQIPWLRILPIFCCFMLWLLIFWAHIFTLYGIRYWCGYGKKSSTCRAVVAVIISHLFSLVSLEPSNLANKSNQQLHSTAYCFLSFDFPFNFITSGPCIIRSSLMTLCIWRAPWNHQPPHTYWIFQITTKI